MHALEPPWPPLNPSRWHVYVSLTWTMNVLDRPTGDELLSSLASLQILQRDHSRWQALISSECANAVENSFIAWRLVTKQGRCVGTKSVSDFPHLSAEDDCSRHTHLRRLHPSRFGDIDAKVDADENHETPGSRWWQGPRGPRPAQAQGGTGL